MRGSEVVLEGSCQEMLWGSCEFGGLDVSATSYKEESEQDLHEKIFEEET